MRDNDVSSLVKRFIVDMKKELFKDVGWVKLTMRVRSQVVDEDNTLMESIVYSYIAGSCVTESKGNSNFLSNFQEFMFSKLNCKEFCRDRFRIGTII